MELASIDKEETSQISADQLPFARSYQLEALEKAIKQNTIVFLETGSGKTLIAIMLLRSYAYLLRKPSPYFSVFLVPQVVLVTQQAEAVKMHTDLKVGQYWGDMGVDYWDAATWQQEIEKHEVIVMTPAILLHGLQHSFFKLNMIKVLIFDECHHARGKYPYATIMRDFYHAQLKSNASDLPRIFGMTASPIKSKGAKSASSYWKQIHELETLMNSKVYTCASESVVAEFIPFSTPKFKVYHDKDIPFELYVRIVRELKILKFKHRNSLNTLDLNDSAVESTVQKIKKIHSTLVYCLKELGIWMALKAAEYLSCNGRDFICWGKLHVFGEEIVKSFSLDASKVLAAYVPSDWNVSDDVQANVDAGLLTNKIVCLVESLLEYRALKDIRCIVFVERVIAAIVLQSLLSQLLPKYTSWKTEHIAGNNSGLQCQSRKKQNETVEEFRKGLVNIIVATSILEEGLDVQSCNLVIRFDPSATICSFIQSRGRARMQNSDYILMVKSGDLSTKSRLENYLSSGDLMRLECQRHASQPCSSLEDDLYEEVYRVPSTGAIVSLSSSVTLIYLYCSRLPSDGYFKPTPRCEIDKEKGTCILQLPKSCPVQTVYVQGNCNLLKQKACFKACIELHKVGALTDNLVPDIVIEEAFIQKLEKEPYDDDQPLYFPPELVNYCGHASKTMYHCYLMELNQNFVCDIPVHNIMLVMRSKLEHDIGGFGLELEVERGAISVNFKYRGVIRLTSEEVLLCRKFQITLLRILLDHKIDNLAEVLDGLKLVNDIEIDYLLLPSTHWKKSHIIDWESVSSVLVSYENVRKHHMNCNAGIVQAKSGLVCPCMLEKSLVYTPHSGHVYCITGIRNDLNANSVLRLRNGDSMTYGKYYELKHGIQLRFGQVPFLNGRHMFTVQNYLHRCRKQKEKEPSNAYVELPPELCDIIMTPISISTIYSFTFVPSIMHRLESLLIAINLKKTHLDCANNVVVPTIKVLEAITAKECQEKFHLESLETLGDSFLKYAVSQQLFKTYENNHEGLLSVKKDKIISNATLCKLGVNHKIPGFIRTESFDPKSWMIPGDSSGSNRLIEESLSDKTKIYVRGRRKLKSKKVADVVEALIGAYLCTGGESAGLSFMNWIGIEVDFKNSPYERQLQVHAEKLVNLRYLEDLLNYSFGDPSLLVEAMTHGSYMLPEIPRCYQRLEFLGDSVLDYLITIHLYNKYPGMSPGLLTDMRSASVNNECYAHAAVKAGLYKHILHASQKLHKDIVETVKIFEKSSPESTFGWESETSFPKVLGDVIESLAGAIFVDSGFNKDVVFQSLRPLLEPLITPETVRFHPVRELNELCQKEHFTQSKPILSIDNGVASITVVVEADGAIFKHKATALDKKTAKKLASKEVLQSLKAHLNGSDTMIS